MELKDDTISISPLHNEAGEGATEMRTTAVERTDDGSATLFVPELQEHYHSTKGALTESLHIFIHMGYQHISAPQPEVLEIGFGTGLNAFLTLLEAEKAQRPTHYTTIERYPLERSVVNTLGYPQLIAPQQAGLFEAIHEAAWDEEVQISPYFTLHKIKGDFTQTTFRGTYDLIYFDAFAPEKQPEMWSPELFNHLFSVLRPEGVLTTYCAKGVVRRMLQAAGFLVERLPGPPQGKREILRGTKR